VDLEEKAVNRIFGLFAGLALLVPLALADRSESARQSVSPLSLEDITAAAFFDQSAPRTSSLKRLVGASSVIGEAALSEAQRCLAQAVYFEARSETLEGQLAVAQVVLNRVEDRRYPTNICGVVFQNERLRHRCQFSFACDGRTDTPYESRAWETAKRISRIALEGGWRDLSGQATHYHATYVDPSWRSAMMKTAAHGRHVFYRDAS
jgi:spore germination cell wall hydrolase CwlJ-like protein